MDYDKIKESDGYNRKKTNKGGHDIPMDDIASTIKNPAFTEEQENGRRVFWGKPEGYNYFVRTVVSATFSAAVSLTASTKIKVARIVTAFIDSGKLNK